MRRYLIFFLVWVMGFAWGIAPAQAQTSAPAPVPQAAPAPPVGQQAELVLGRPAFPINEYYTIAIRLRGARLDRYSAFPDIEGFKKSGKTSTTTTRIVEGRSTVELLLTQRYAAFAEGEFVLKPFTITVNGQVLRSAGATLRVSPQPAAPAASAASPDPKAPLQGLGLLDQLLGKPKPQEYVEQPDQAFLAVVPDKTSAWVGEPVHVGLYFYLAATDQGLLDFHRFAEQLPGIVRQLRQPSTWEESFDETDILPDSVRIGGKPFLRYRLHEAVYYPLNDRPLTFPAVALQMKKYRVARRPVPGTDNRLTGYKTYRSQPRTVAVKLLPPHPAREQVPVGRYRVREGVDRTRFKTGETITYTLVMEGEGNLTAVPVPEPVLPPGLEVYGPDVRQEISRENGRVGGRKILRYRFVPRQPDTLRLAEMFPLLTFDFATGKYSWVRPELQLIVTGAVVAPPPAVTAFVRTDPFYEQLLARASNTTQSLDAMSQVKQYANMVLMLLLALAVLGWLYARRS